MQVRVHFIIYTFCNLLAFFGTPRRQEQKKRRTWQPTPKFTSVPSSPLGLALPTFPLILNIVVVLHLFGSLVGFTGKTLVLTKISRLNFKLTSFRLKRFVNMDRMIGLLFESIHGLWGNWRHWNLRHKLDWMSLRVLGKIRFKYIIDWNKEPLRIRPWYLLEVWSPIRLSKNNCTNCRRLKWSRTLLLLQRNLLNLRFMHLNENQSWTN